MRILNWWQYKRVYPIRSTVPDSSMIWDISVKQVSWWCSGEARGAFPGCLLKNRLPGTEQSTQWEKNANLNIWPIWGTRSAEKRCRFSTLTKPIYTSSQPCFARTYGKRSWTRAWKHWGDYMVLQHLQECEFVIQCCSVQPWARCPLHSGGRAVQKSSGRRSFSHLSGSHAGWWWFWIRSSDGRRSACVPYQQEMRKDTGRTVKQSWSRTWECWGGADLHQRSGQNVQRRAVNHLWPHSFPWEKTNEWYPTTHFMKQLTALSLPETFPNHFSTWCFIYEYNHPYEGETIERICLPCISRRIGLVDVSWMWRWRPKTTGFLLIYIQK